MRIAKLTEDALIKAKTIGGKPGLNCIAEIDPTAMVQAIISQIQDCTKQYPLLRLPILIKDNIDVKGMHTTAGSLALSDNLAESDAPIIKNLRKNGAVILGKTNMTEFANYTTAGMPAGYSSRGGQVVHAINPTLSPSGSSSGSAVAVSAGIVSAAVGTDTSFSTVACALENGVCGLKPPVGVLPSKGIIPIAKTLDSAGAIAQNFSDALTLYSAMRDEPFSSVEAVSVGSLKIAVNTANSDRISENQLSFLQKTVALLEEQGACTQKIEQAPTPYQGVIMQWEFKAHLEEYLRTSNTSRKTLAEIVDFYESNPDTMMKYGITLLKKALLEAPGGLHGEPYLEAMEIRTQSIQTMHQTLANYDAVIMTGPTNIMHFCGLPSVSIVGSEKNKYGVRRGFIMYGLDEYKLYKAALSIEKLLTCSNS